MTTAKMPDDERATLALQLARLAVTVENVNLTVQNAVTDIKAIGEKVSKDDRRLAVLEDKAGRDPWKVVGGIVAIIGIFLIVLKDYTGM